MNLPLSLSGALLALALAPAFAAAAAEPVDMAAIGKRMAIEVSGLDRHVFAIYFTLPGQPEILADRMVFDRIR